MHGLLILRHANTNIEDRPCSQRDTEEIVGPIWCLFSLFLWKDKTNVWVVDVKNYV